MQNDYRNFLKYITYFLLGLFSPFLMLITLSSISFNWIYFSLGIILFLTIQKILRQWSGIKYSTTKKIFIYGGACIWWLIIFISAGIYGITLETNRAKSQLVNLIRRCWVSGRLAFNENPSFGSMMKDQKKYNYNFGSYTLIDTVTGTPITSIKASESSCFDITAESSNALAPTFRAYLPRINDPEMVKPQNFTESLLIKSPTFNKNAWLIQKPDGNNLKTLCKKSDSLAFGCDPSKNFEGNAW